MKITVVTHDSLVGRYVAATLVAHGAADRVLIETQTASWAFYWRKLRRVGLVNFLFQMWLARWFAQGMGRHLPDLALPAHARIRTLNDLTFADDELVVAFGSSYITARTLGRAPLGILNLHTGLLPAYRGVKSEF